MTATRFFALADEVLSVTESSIGDLDAREIREWLEDLELAPTIYDHVCNQLDYNPLGR